MQEEEKAQKMQTEHNELNDQEEQEDDEEEKEPIQEQISVEDFAENEPATYSKKSIKSSSIKSQDESISDSSSVTSKKGRALNKYYDPNASNF